VMLSVNIFQLPAINFLRMGQFPFSFWLARADSLRHLDRVGNAPVDRRFAPAGKDGIRF